MAIDRREFLKVSAGAAGAAAVGLTGCASSPAIAKSAPKVVVVGAGFGGSTFARYMKMWYPQAEVTIIEPNPVFTSCPFSNTVLAGINKMEDLTLPYDNIKAVVNNFVADYVTAIDNVKQTVTTKGGKTFAYDKLVLAGGVELLFDKVQGYDAETQKTIKHAWKASADQTGALRQQLEAMPDGGTFVMSVPMAPYRCPPRPLRARLYGRPVLQKIQAEVQDHHPGRQPGYRLQEASVPGRMEKALRRHDRMAWQQPAARNRCRQDDGQHRV
jgi:hypothetical protein